MAAAEYVFMMCLKCSEKLESASERWGIRDRSIRVKRGSTAFNLDSSIFVGWVVLPASLLLP